MKTVFTSDELPHIWATRRAPYGRAPSAMSFDGDRFKSYSTTIAARFTSPAGGDVYLLSTRKYSNTTTSHQSAVYRAVSGTIVRGPSDCLSSPEAFARDLLRLSLSSREAAASTQASHPRRKSQIAASLAESRANLSAAARVSELFNLGLDCSDSALDALAAENAASAAAYEKAQAVARKRAEKESRAALKKWLAGESVSHYGLPNGQTYLRLTPSGDVETSKGVTIERAEAKLALRFISSKRADGWRRNGETFPIAGYQLDSVTPEGIVAGCHRVMWPEIEKISAAIK